MRHRCNGQPSKLMALRRRAGGGQGGNPMGPMGGPMDFGRNKSKFQEVPETGITFDDVAVRVLFCAFAHVLIHGHKGHKSQFQASDREKETFLICSWMSIDKELKTVE